MVRRALNRSCRRVAVYELAGTLRADTTGIEAAVLLRCAKRHEMAVELVAGHAVTDDLDRIRRSRLYLTAQVFQSATVGFGHRRQVFVDVVGRHATSTRGQV